MRRDGARNRALDALFISSGDTRGPVVLVRTLGILREHEEGERERAPHEVHLAFLASNKKSYSGLHSLSLRRNI